MHDTFTVLHVLAPAPFGGLESVVRLLAIGQQARGYRVIVAANAEPGPHALLDELVAAGVVVDRFQASSRQGKRERAHIRALIQRHHVQIVHTHGYRPDILDLAVAKKAGVAAATTLHGFTGGDWKMRLYERLQVRAIRHADAVFAASAGIVTRCERHGVRRERIHLTRNAFAAAPNALEREDARQALGLDGTVHHMVWIGRLSEEKAPDRMIEAFAAVHNSTVHLSIIGDGPMRAALQGRVATLGLAAQVTFHGAVPNAARYLRAFDSFVLSSRTEGTPMVLLEAMAADIPIVATAVGGVPDVVSSNEAELVNADGDEGTIVARLAQGLHQVVAGGATIEQRVQAAQTRLGTVFGVEPWLDRYEAVYRAICHLPTLGS